MTFPELPELPADFVEGTHGGLRIRVLQLEGDRQDVLADVTSDWLRQVASVGVAAWFRVGDAQGVQHIVEISAVELQNLACPLTYPLESLIWPPTDTPDS